MAENSATTHLRGLSELVFVCGFALLVCHELDAVAQSEWKLLPLLNALPDDTAYGAFIVGHIPLFAALLWLLAHRSAAVRRRTRLGVDLFVIAHAGVHWLMSGHALYTFHSALSNFLIFGAGIAGLLHILLLTVASRRPVDR